MSNAFEYLTNPEIIRHINKLTSHINNQQDLEDCRQEVWAELYDIMPLDDDEAKALITRVVKKFEWRAKNISDHEVSFDE